MVAPSERLQRQGKERQPALKGLLGQIANDVAIGVRSVQGIPQNTLINDFRQRLIEGIQVLHSQLSPGGQDYMIMQVLIGDEFTQQPLATKLEMVAKTNALPEEKKKEMALAGLERLYKKYQTATQGPNSQKAWENFVNAYKLCSAGLEIVYPPSFYYDELSNYNLPSLYGDLIFSPHYLSTSETLTNTELQLQMAKATGVLEPNETWLDFIHRDNIKIVGRLHEINDHDKGFILAQVSDDEDFTLGGMPRLYYNILTKYPGVEATVSFDYRRDSSGKYNDKLDKLITNGDISPRVMLRIPTPAFLPSESK